MKTNLNWFNNYKQAIDLSQNDFIINSIKLLSDKNHNTINNKISQIEQDYNNKIQYIEYLYDNIDKINEIKTYNSLIILQKESEIIKILTKYTLQNKILDYNFLKKSLLLLLEFSEFLRLKLGQKIFNNNINLKYNLKHNEINSLDTINSQDNSQDNSQNNSQDKNIIISRCSYKFCSYQADCYYNYDTKSKKICYQDHYVHNMVSSDLQILLNYIEEKRYKQFYCTYKRNIKNYKYIKLCY